MRPFYFLLNVFVVVLMFCGLGFAQLRYNKMNRKWTSHQTVEIVNLKARVHFLEHEFRVLRIGGDNMHNRLLELEKERSEK